MAEFADSQSLVQELVQKDKVWCFFSSQLIAKFWLH